jgi:hypothetical protein
MRAIATRANARKMASKALPPMQAARQVPASEPASTPGGMAKPSERRAALVHGFANDIGGVAKVQAGASKALIHDVIHLSKARNLDLDLNESAAGMSAPPRAASPQRRNPAVPRVSVARRPPKNRDIPDAASIRWLPSREKRPFQTVRCRKLATMCRATG